MKKNSMMIHDSPQQRRQFLQRAAAAGAGLAASSVAQGEDGSRPLADANRAARGVIETSADVVVVGGGTAGIIAAIQAARAGASTLLVERGSELGGTMTVGGVCFPGLFHAWGRQVIAGIGWELVRLCVEMDGGRLPDFSTPTGRQHWRHQVVINPFLYSLLAEEACQAARVKICYYEFPLAIEESAKGCSLDIVGPGTARRVACRQVIDCTGGGDVVGLAGFERLREGEIQPGSMLYKLGAEFQAGRETLQAVYVHGADSSNSVTRTEANLTGRRSVLQQIRKQRAGGQESHLAKLQPEASFRESYRILGETVVTVDDYVSGRVFDDAVCHAFYPVDLHTSSGVQPKHLDEGVVPTVPLRALVPKGSRHLMAAGRGVSSDRLANSALRVQATCMATGQVAGAAAALAARADAALLEVPLDEIRKLLREHGAIVPGMP